jgi:hypothetical protein
LRCRILQRKILLARPRGRWEDNINMHVTEIGYEVVDWIERAGDGNK